MSLAGHPEQKPSVGRQDEHRTAITEAETVTGTGSERWFSLEGMKFGAIFGAGYGIVYEGALITVVQGSLLLDRMLGPSTLNSSLNIEQMSLVVAACAIIGALAGGLNYDTLNKPSPQLPPESRKLWE